MKQTVHEKTNCYRTTIEKHQMCIFHSCYIFNALNCNLSRALSFSLSCICKKKGNREGERQRKIKKMEKFVERGQTISNQSAVWPTATATTTKTARRRCGITFQLKSITLNTLIKNIDEMNKGERASERKKEKKTKIFWNLFVFDFFLSRVVVILLLLFVRSISVIFISVFSRTCWRKLFLLNVLFEGKCAHANLDPRERARVCVRRRYQRYWTNKEKLRRMCKTKKIKPIHAWEK